MRTTSLFLFALVSFAAASCRSAPASSDRTLHALFAEEWEQRIAEDPLLATGVGRRDGLGRLPSVTPDDLERRADQARQWLTRLAKFDRDRLSDENRIHYDILERQLSHRVREFEFGAWQMPLTVDEGFHIDFAQLPSYSPLESTSDYEGYIARLEAFPEYVGEQVANMRRGLARGMTLPRIVLEGYEVTIETHVVDDPRESVFYAPFESFPAAIAAGDRARLEEEGRRAILGGAVAGYRLFLDFMTGEYIPEARESLGASELPNGRAYYEHLIDHFTTLELTPEEIHELGRAEVARIRAEMQDVIHAVGFEGDFAAFLQFLRTDPRFYAETPHQLLAEAAWICKRMDAELPKLFGTLPRLPYGVEPVPAHLAPKYTSGRYSPPAEGTGEPGFYWVNTYALESRPLYVLPALSLHEAVPGHHLQGQIARERAQLPPFRRYSYISAYGEGWALYAEWLGLEAGIYDDPYSNFGRLTYEMWRACRLVVDTGLHAMGWTREQAMDFMASHTALSLHEVRTETDRYISWPGQALSYKIGELEIKRLRHEAEEALGEQFDLRAFHDAVLASGSVPLSVLRDEMRRFIERQLER